MTRADLPVMTPAEFKATRERLGLTVRWLAERWGVQETTIQRWERNRALPSDLAEDMGGLAGRFDVQVDALRAAGAAVLRVPRRDGESPDQMPAAWHRAAALTAVAGTGSRIEWIPGEPQ